MIYDEINEGTLSVYSFTALYYNCIISVFLRIVTRS